MHFRHLQQIKRWTYHKLLTKCATKGTNLLTSNSCFQLPNADKSTAKVHVMPNLYSWQSRSKVSIFFVYGCTIVIMVAWPESLTLMVQSKQDKIIIKASKLRKLMIYTVQDAALTKNKTFRIGITFHYITLIFYFSLRSTLYLSWNVSHNLKSRLQNHKII